MMIEVPDDLLVEAQKKSNSRKDRMYCGMIAGLYYQSAIHDVLSEIAEQLEKSHLLLENLVELRIEETES
jgi:hypothetical protein